MQCDEDGDKTTSKADVEAIFVVNIERESIRVDDPWKSGWCKKKLAFFSPQQGMGLT